MALNAAQQWWVRAGGDQLNGGGFDATIASAGTNYADQDAPQLTITDATTSGAGSTTLTSATGGFTAAMIGNVFRIASGTNFQTGYYAITARADANNITLDRTPTSAGAGSGGTGRIGGAHPSLINYSNGGSATAPTIATPLAAGHTVNIRGGGSSDPSSADYTQTGYRQFPDGDTTSGKIKWVGYNGRPRFNCDGLLCFALGHHTWTHIKFVAQNTTNGANGILNGNNGNKGVSAVDCIFDQNGNDVIGAYCGARFCWFKNTGGATAGTLVAIKCENYNDPIFGNYINGWKGGGIDVNSAISTIAFNIIVNTKLIGILCGSTSATSPNQVLNNTIHGNTSDGIKLPGAGDMSSVIMNNIITGNGGFGINCAVGTTALNDRRKVLMDYNNLGTGATANTSGAYNNVSAGAHDLALDPQFTDAAGGDYSVGANMKAAAYPGTFLTA